MKLIMAIMRDSDSDTVSTALTSSGFRITSVASTGGFLRRGQTTAMIGVEDDQVEKALDIIRSSCTQPSAEDVRHTILFVLDVNQFDHF
ncbi:MAG: cyclic-di-AMP receptor [Anaerolineae bacterium]|nr:cyclic-di-AMP receptor [Anaerolineae bacterium]